MEMEENFINIVLSFSSFQDIANMKNVISRVKGSQPAPILLVANKLDLECQREVATSEGKCQSLLLPDTI